MPSPTRSTRGRRGPPLVTSLGDRYRTEEPGATRISRKRRHRAVRSGAAAADSQSSFDQGVVRYSEVPASALGSTRMFTGTEAAGIVRIHGFDANSASEGRVPRIRLLWPRSREELGFEDEASLDSGLDRDINVVSASPGNGRLHLRARFNFGR